MSKPYYEHSGDVKVVNSDRLPSYSESTLDIEIDGMEVASISYRNDYVSKKIKALEIAFGLDRLVELSR
jgi:translation elongation factor EF-1beta